MASASDAPLLPRARFAPAHERDAACERLASSMALVVRVSVGPSARGRLSDVIDEAIERELDARGSAPPGIGASSDADAALSDQLFRARRVGAMGLAIALGPLRAATSARGAVEPEDSATLRFWASATCERPVWLFLDASDAVTSAYGDPVSLATVLADTRAHESHESYESRESYDSEPDTSPPPPPAEATATPPAAIPNARLTANAEGASDEDSDVDAAAAVVVHADADAIADSAPNVDPAATADFPADEAQTDATQAPVAARPPLAKPSELSARHTSGAAIADADDAWRAWALSLSAARGPQPLAAFERLFARDYMPLADAIARGLDEPRALHAHDEFRRTFARAYADACPAFAVTGKRPRMVMDAHDIAARIARLHGARTTQLLLVDAMRFDVGTRVKEGVCRALGAQASLTDELILWSALPTTTARQLETLQRGADALRAPSPDSERDTDPLRGRTAEVIRRVRVGSRDLYKLDVVEARVRELGSQAATALAALDDIADSAAEAIARHAHAQKPRTLLFVFGDHGFTFDRGGVASHGGASPEEVLVPAFALLVGDVH